MRVEKLRRLYRQFPDAYAADVLKAKLTEDQAQILFSLVDNRRTAVQASHAVGKTHCAAIAGNWWYDCWPENICYITAPTWKQALGLTFKYLIRMRREFKLGGEILESGIVRDPDKNLAGSHYIQAINAENGEGFQGEHSAPILIILEEAVGVPSYIWEASDGLMTRPECRFLGIANPTDESTPFGSACSSSIYHNIIISALDHPNIAAELRSDEPPYPKAVRLGWVQEMVDKECEPSDAGGDAFEWPPKSGQYFIPNAVFQGRVKGQFPTQADQQVIPRGWLMSLPVLDLGNTVPEIGCDVARGGADRSTIAGRCGPAVLKLREIRQMNNIAVADACKTMADELGEKFNIDSRMIPIRIDITGGLGTGPYDLLMDWGYKAAGVNASSLAIETEKYPNQRSELWFTVRRRVYDREMDLSRLPADMREKLIKELATPKWGPDARGRHVVEPKKDIKKRLGESPDLADALNLAFAAGTDFRPVTGPERFGVVANRTVIHSPVLRPSIHPSRL